MLRIHPRVLLATLAAALIPIPSAPAEVTRTLRIELKGDPGGAFAVENLAGHMTIRRGRGPGVVAVATVHAESDALASAMRFEQVEGRHQVATLRVRYPPNSDQIRYRGAGDGGPAAWFGGGRSSTRYDGRRVSVSGSRGDEVWADVVVELPASVGDARFANHVGKLDARGIEGRDLLFDTAAGSIELSDIGGRVRADTGSGDVSAARLRGRFVCDTGSGACRLDGFEGESVSCDTGSGRIDIAGARAERVAADTGSGDIRIVSTSARSVEADTGSGDVRIETAGDRLASLRADTGSGDVTLELGDAASFELRADMGSGELHSGFADAEPIRRRDRIVGYRRGDARTRITVDTGSGDVRVRP